MATQCWCSSWRSDRCARSRPKQSTAIAGGSSSAASLLLACTTQERTSSSMVGARPVARSRRLLASAGPIEGHTTELAVGAVVMPAERAVRRGLGGAGALACGFAPHMCSPWATLEAEGSRAKQPCAWQLAAPTLLEPQCWLLACTVHPAALTLPP